MSWDLCSYLKGRNSRPSTRRSPRPQSLSSQPVESDCDTSIESLSRFSTTSEPDAQPITPYIQLPIGLASPVQLYDSPVASSPHETPATTSTRTSTPRTGTFGSPDILSEGSTVPDHPVPFVEQLLLRLYRLKRSSRACKGTYS